MVARIEPEIIVLGKNELILNFLKLFFLRSGIFQWSYLNMKNRMLRFGWLTGELFDRISDNRIFGVNNYRKGGFIFFQTKYKD